MLSISRRIIASTRRVVSGINNNNNNAVKSHLLSRSSISADFSNVAWGTSSSYHTSSVSSSNRNFWNLPSSSRRFSLPHQQKRMFSVSTEILETLGDSITSAVLVSWSKEAGDTVREDDVIAIVETDKVTMDIKSKKDGIFLEGLVEAGAEVLVGDPIYKFDSSVTVAPAPNAEASSPSMDSTPPVPKANTEVKKMSVDVPIMGESITTGALADWSVEVGDFASADSVVAIIETDKVSVEVRMPEDGQILELFAAAGDEVNVGEPLFSIDTNAVGPPKQQKSAEEDVPVATPQAAAASIPAPSAPAAKAPESPKAPAPIATPEMESDVIVRSETRVKMTRMRQRISQRLKEAQNTAAMLTTFQECDMTNLIALRNKYKESFEKEHNVKLGFMSAFVTASARALEELPVVNAYIDDTTQEIVFRNYVDISVAVASPNGLVVPVLRNTEKMNFADVEKSIGFYAGKAKNGTLALEEMTGGCFTISNGGVFGSLMGTPIINPPQSAILGMHATKMRAVVVDGKVEARPMMYLALTYDHRLIDGREAVTFLKSIAGKIEDPSRMLLGL